VFASPNVERLFGWRPADLIGRSAYELFHPDDIARIAADHAGHQTDEPGLVRYRLRRADGVWRWVETSSRARRTDDGVAQILCFTRDVHDEETAREALAVAERTAALGRLAAAIGHELANPLAAAVIGAGYLRSRAGSRDPIIETVIESLERANDVITELRLLGARPSNAPADLDLAEVVLRLSEMTGLGHAAGVTAAPVSTDPARLHQLVFHLLHLHGAGATFSTGVDSGRARLVIRSSTSMPGTPLRVDLLSAIRGERRSEHSTTRLVELLVAEVGGTITRAETEEHLESRIELPAR